MNDLIKIADNGIEKLSVVNGPGLRYTIFTQGCSHNCKGCHNPQTHDFNYGRYISVDSIIDDIINMKGIISGITITGGDPLFYKNYFSVLNLCKLIKENKLLEDIDIWIYTGYDWNSIKNKEIIKYCDVIVDGRFVEGLKSYNLKFKGSSNQNIIDVKKSIEKGSIIEWKN